MIWSHDRVLRRLPLRAAALLLAALTAGAVLPTAATAASAAGGTPSARPALRYAVGCDSSLTDQTAAAAAVFTGEVTDSRRVSADRRTVVYEQDVTVEGVYKGLRYVGATTVTVRTERSRDSECAIGRLAEGSEFVFFVGRSGEDLVARDGGGTAPRTADLEQRVTDVLGNPRPPVPPEPEPVVYTGQDVTDVPPFSRLAAPGAALVLMGLLGLFVVRRVARH